MISRREFLSKTMKTSLSLGLLPGLAACGREPVTTDGDLPNVLVITADDLGWKDLSCYGNRNIETPNIDRLAKEGALFEKAFVVASSCAPSRASLITGQYPHTNGVTGLTHIHKTRALSPFHQTMPDMLSNRGYNTALQGKWHVSPYMPTSWYGYRERLSSFLPKGFHIHSSEKARQFISENSGNRFYLELNFMQNHRDAYGEFTMDPEFPVDPESLQIPEYMTLPDSKGLREDLAKFYSQTLRMDAMVGEILDELDRLDLTENTMVIFISDNGPPYPGNKMTLYDRGAAVPLLVRYPEKVKAGKRIASMVNSIDCMPTVLEAAGIPVPESVQGQSLWGMLTGDKAEKRDAIFMEMTHHVRYVPMRAVRTERYKYIRNFSDNPVGLDQNSHDDWAQQVATLPNQPWLKPRVKEELYDLLKDPHEQNNLIAQQGYAAVKDEMQRRLRSHMVATKDHYLDAPFTKDYDPGEYLPTVPGEKYK